MSKYPSQKGFEILITRARISRQQLSFHLATQNACKRYKFPVTVVSLRLLNLCGEVLREKKQNSIISSSSGLLKRNVKEQRVCIV